MNGKYRNIDGEEISLFRLVREEPDWAVSIIPHLKATIEKQAKEISRLESVIDKANSIISSEAVKRSLSND
jgi:hypothetical protein